MSAADQNAHAFDRQAVVAAYLEETALTSLETALFSRFVLEGSDVLDLGVGAGRTTSFLGGRARSYVGVDIALNMIDAARSAHPGVDLRVGDAADLSPLADSSIDVVVFSYNGLDYLTPEANRQKCLSEVARVLRPGGHFVFSTHYARGFWRVPKHRYGHLRWLAVTVYQSGRAVDRLVRSRVALHGRGYYLDPAHGGLTTYATSPSHVAAELVAAGLIPVLAPAEPSPHLRHPWLHYVAQRPAGPSLDSMPSARGDT